MRWVLILFLLGCSKETISPEMSRPILFNIISSPSDLIQRINSFRGQDNAINRTFIHTIYSQYVIWSPLSEEWGQFYTIQKELSPTDSYFTSGYDWGLCRYFRCSLPDSTTGSYAGASAGYTTQIGATATITFNGTGLDFLSYQDQTGGKWQYVLDGAAPVEFSVYNATGRYYKQSLFSGISYGSHTVVFTFLGADVSTVGGPFGWIARNSTSTTDQGVFAKCFYIIGSDTPNLCYPVQLGATAINPAYVIDNSNSGHREMSFSVLAASGTTAVINNWIPNHSSVETAAVFANVATDRTLKIDGVGSDLFASLTNNDVTLATGGTYIELRQVYDGVNKDDDILPLWEVTDITRFNTNGITYIQDWLSLVNHAPSTAYPTMFAVGGSLSSHVLVNGTEIDLSATVVDQVISDNASLPTWNGQAMAIQKTGTDLDKSIVMGFKMDNIVTSMNLSTNYGQRMTWTKNGTLKKLYPTIFVGYQIPAGVRFTWTTKITMGFVSDAYNTLKSYCQI